MSKKIVIITSSLRAHSNSDALAESFSKGAKEAGNDVEVISLKEKKIGYCIGCLACQETQQCVIKDDAMEIAGKIKDADAVAFATPVYYYSISGQLKTMLDRCNPLYPSDYSFRDIYLLATAAEEEESAVKGSITALQGWIDCFESAHLAGTVFAGGVNDAGEMEGHPAADTAYKMGKSI